MKIYKKAILPLGFTANAVSAGIKRSGRLDLALFHSDLPALAAGKFTTNTIPAAPVILSRKHLKSGKKHRAVIVNSGNANCFTAQAGLADAEKTAVILAKALGAKKEEILVNSTGVIGRRLPMGKIISAIPDLTAGLGAQGIDKAKLAIMTTDIFAKEISVKLFIGGREVTLCGIAKGAGMIAPNMATMLAFIFTDADITKKALDKALDAAVESSFNCITVDGCMSTNDTVLLLANGASAAPLISGGNELKKFSAALNKVCLELAKMIVRDAEGGSKFIQVRVENAGSFREARQVALAIANSSLFKTAVYGENPNFGRIAAAVGASGVEVKEKGLKIKVSRLDKKEIDVAVSINRGRSGAVVYTSDLTPEYVKINAEYN